MLVLQLILIFLGGIAGGFYGSTVGGGALVALPLLILVGLPTPLALGTLRFGVVFLELVSSVRFYRAGKLKLQLGLLLGVIAMGGTFLGVNLLISINVGLMNIIVAILLIIVAMVLLNKDKLGIKEHVMTRRNSVLLALSTAVMGIYAGFFGAGSGVFWTLLLVIFGYSFIESAGIARVVGLCTSLVATIIFGIHGLINYQLAIALASGFAAGSWIGIGVTLRKGDKYIKAVLVLVVAFSVVKLLLNAFGIHTI
jgi:uncharacterized protein